MNLGCYRVVKELLLRNWVSLPADSVVLLFKVEVTASSSYELSRRKHYFLLNDGTTTEFMNSDAEAMSRLLEPL